MVDVDEAIRILFKMQSAAPPVAAARLNDVIETLQELRDSNIRLADELGVLTQRSIQAEVEAERRIESSTSTFDPSRLGNNIIIERNEAPDDDPVLQQLAEAINALQDHASLLQRTYNDLFKARTGGYRRVQFSPSDLIRRTAVEYEAIARQTAHTIGLQVEDDLPDAIGDTQAISMILGDLIENALQYSPEGSEVRIAAQSLGTDLLVTVTDFGIGLSEEDMERVGEPFYRAANQPMVERHVGTGLRIYLAKQVLQGLGGALFFSGELGVGSSFSFTLPLSKR